MTGMVMFSGSPLIALAEAPTYTVQITSAVATGMNLNLSGLASATKFAGQISD